MTLNIARRQAFVVLAVVVVTCVLAVATVVSAQGRRPAPMSQVTTPGSASTLITSIASLQATGGRVEVLVLWRGTPGWYLKGAQRTSGGGTPKSFSASFTYGEVSMELTLTLDPERTLTIQDRSVELGANNVVLVDHTDSATGPVVVKTLHVDASIGDPRDLAPVIARSAELVQFLKCEVRLETPRAQATTGALCEMLGR